MSGYFSLNLLRGHVAELAFDLALARRLRAARGDRHAKVENSRNPVDADQHVLRAHVAVHETERLSVLVSGFVGRVKAVQRSAHDGGRDANGHRSDRSGSAQQPRKGFALHVVHDEKELAFGRHDIERLDDIRVSDARSQTRLVDEHGNEFAVPRELRVQSFDSDRPRKPYGPAQAPKMHRCHAARGKLVVEGVAPNDSRRLLFARLQYQNLMLAACRSRSERLSRLSCRCRRRFLPTIGSQVGGWFQPFNRMGTARCTARAHPMQATGRTHPTLARNAPALASPRSVSGEAERGPRTAMRLGSGANHGARCSDSRDGFQFTIALTTLVTAADAGGVTQNIRAAEFKLAQSVSVEHPTASHAPFTHTVPENLASPTPEVLQVMIRCARKNACSSDALLAHVTRCDCAFAVRPASRRRAEARSGVADVVCGAVEIAHGRLALDNAGSRLARAIRTAHAAHGRSG